MKGKAPKVETEEEERPSGDNVIDLMAALKRSLEGGGQSAAAKAAAPAARSRGKGRGRLQTAGEVARPQSSRAQGCTEIRLSDGEQAADSLTEYRRKRDFAKTAEPAGKVARKKGYSFLVQKHDATRLHYDFRLELDGVLKSWAVTRGPSLDPGEKRLAVHVEDHPLDYGGFEGTIPKGEYGGGTVMLWDRGTWEPLDDPREGLKKGRLHFRLHGERLKGGWALIRMPPRGKEKRENWLLIKERDEFADDSDPLLEKFTTSVKSGRTMEKIAAGDSVWHSNKKARGSPEASARTRRTKARALSLPKFRPPQLATLVKEPPEGDDWVHEFKYDGYRLLIAANGSSVRCYTRSGQDWTEKFQPIADAIAAMDLAGVLIDGEAASFSPDGRSDFSTLQKALSEGGTIEFFAFDLLEEDGKDITKLPLLERKNAAAGALRRSAEGQPHPFQHAYRRRWAKGSEGDLRRRPRGHRFEEGVGAVSRRARQDLAQDQMQQAAGIRHRRLDAVRQAQRLPLAAPRHLAGWQARLQRPRRHRVRRSRPRSS